MLMKLLLVGVAGAVGITFGGSGFGAAIGISHADSDVVALIENTDMEADHDVLAT